MDIDMPGRSCCDATEMIHAKCPKSAVVFLSAFANDHYIEKALLVDAAGYVVIDESVEAVVDAIRQSRGVGGSVSGDRGQSRVSGCRRSASGRSTGLLSRCDS